MKDLQIKWNRFPHQKLPGFKIYWKNYMKGGYQWANLHDYFKVKRWIHEGIGWNKGFRAGIKGHVPERNIK